MALVARAGVHVMDTNKCIVSDHVLQVLEHELAAGTQPIDVNDYESLTI